ncbi:uncharacterized protein LOC134540134 [Bacillus rossius redtenbacheri]|uniref:uncharacterized protein LOC134540134 n=1 Tax=Bacillus rossius redtenbacheri TaxID=93214 RepID=UPI002FDEE7B4
MFPFGGAIYEVIRGFSSSSQPVKDEYLDAEYDTAERYANVDLFSKVVEGLTSVDGATAGTGSAHHWALVVHFEDDSYRLLEGNVNDDGYLHAYYRKHRGDGLTRLRALGRVRVSPSGLREIARLNRLNGSKYDLVDNNCQDWAVQAAKDISAEVGRAAAAVPRIAPVLSAARSVALGATFGPSAALLGLGYRR